MIFRKKRINRESRRSFLSEIESLSPWYQPINFGYGIKTVVRDKKGRRYRPWTLDRGLRKWRAFIKPNLPFHLTGKRVLEVGCNAGLFLTKCVREGAREAIGVEKDDHYYRQASFVTNTFKDLHGRYYPVRIFQGAMESFDYQALGKFDLALLLNVIYHIGKSADYHHLNAEEVTSLQVKTLQRVSQVAEHLLFQGNPLEDEGRGKGRHSLRELVDRSDLEIVKETVYDHPRGLILLTKSKEFRKEELFPIKRMISKYFLPVNLSAEKEIVSLYTKYGRNGFDVTQTRYYRLRTGQINWKDHGVAHLPSDLNKAPAYWIMPWSYKKRKESTERDIRLRIKSFPKLFAKFVDLLDSILDKGFDPEKTAVPGYLLVHPDHGDVFIYIDGNHRMGVLSYLAEREHGGDLMIRVDVRQVVERNKLLDYPLTQQLMEEGHFSEKDVLKWFDNAFWFLNKDIRKNSVV